MPPTRPSNPRRLSYAPRVLCCAHEVAPGEHGIAEAEMIVGGCSFCYPCGQAILGECLNPRSPYSLGMVGIILQEYQAGIREIAP
jgi:hypothetical protein